MLYISWLANLMVLERLLKHPRLTRWLAITSNFSSLSCPRVLYSVHISNWLIIRVSGDVLLKPIVLAAGTDISHWFNKKTREVHSFLYFYIPLRTETSPQISKIFCKSKINSFRRLKRTSTRWLAANSIIPPTGDSSTSRLHTPLTTGQTTSADPGGRTTNTASEFCPRRPEESKL